MYIKSLQKRPKLSLLIVGALFAISAVVAPLLSVMPAYAFQDNDGLPITQQHARTQLYAIGACFEINDFAEPVTGDQLNKHDFWGNTNSQKERTVSVGHEIDLKDGLRECRNMDYDAALGFIGMTWAEFRDAAYKQNSSGGYTRIDGAEEKLDKLLQQKREAKRQSSSKATGPKEENRRNAVALARCIEPIPSGGVAENKKVTIDKKSYQYKDDKDSGSEISIGHDIDKDGRRTCGTLVSRGADAFAALPAGTDIDSFLKSGGTIAGVTNDSNPTGGSDSKDSGQPDCDVKASSPLSWILCPIIDLGANFSDFALNKIISPLLSDVPITTDPKDGGYIAWKQFRLLGNILLIGSLLAVVYAQARGDK